MQQFPDGAHVRLRSREHGGYLHADEDGMGVSLSWGIKSTSMGWKVRRILRDGSTCLLLHSAAYCGRYLAATSDPAPPGHRVVLGDCDDLVVWKAVESGSAGYVLLRHVVSNRLLGWQQNTVSLDVPENESAMMHWKVETIPMILAPPPEPAAAMEKFPDGAHVRLRSRVLSTYVRAEVDRVGISLSPYRGSLNTAWTVRRVVRDGVMYVAFRGDAYGSYIALCPEVTGQRVVQRICDVPEDDVDILWVATWPRDGGAANVLLRHGAHDAYLVTGTPQGDESRRRQWLVEVIPHDTPALRSPTLTASDAHVAALVPATEFFPDRAHVRLRSRTSGSYLFAGDDGVGVFMSPHRETLNTVWAVHQVQRHGRRYTLLHSAAYGRYLAYSASAEAEQPPASSAEAEAERPPPGLLVQNHYFHDKAQADILWQFFRRRSEASSSTVTMYHHDGRHELCWGPWEVERVPLRARPPLLPDPPSDQDEQNLMWRNVWYVLGDDYGNYNQRCWSRIKFQGRSVSELRDRLAEELEEEHPVRIVLALWAGYLGRLTPLVIDLPSNDYTIKIIVYVSWTGAAISLQHPNVDAPEPAPGIRQD